MKTTTTATVWKRTCDCDGGEARWLKCPHPWYMKQFMWQGRTYDPNLTRYAQDVLRETLTTKTRAEEVAEAIRAAVRAGTYQSAKAARAALPVVATAGLTVADVIKRYDADVISADALKRDTTKGDDRTALRRFAEFIPPKRKTPVGAWQIADVKVDVLIAFRTSAPIRKLANSTWAKYRTALTALLRWATAEGFATGDVFADARADQLRLLRRGKGARRTRRVLEDEEARLLRAAGRAHLEGTATRLQALIVAAIETGMRRGELLALTWRDVSFDDMTILVRAEEVGASKTGTSRLLPMSERLRDEVLPLQINPNGDRFGRADYVFGDAVGGQLTTVRKAWQTAVLRANGHEPVWTRTALSAGSRQKLDIIDLHFHDLRHEAGCRWLESKVFDLEQIRQMYGHTTVAQTARYLHASGQSSRTAMQAYDAQRKRLQADAKAQVVGAAEVQLQSSKSPANAKNGRRSASGPRLVKGCKA
jgi:integrase